MVRKIRPQHPPQHPSQHPPNPFLTLAQLDGPELVIELFNPSSNTGGDCFEGRDAREDLDKREVKLKSNYWNEALVLLRELSYLHPNIASDFITKVRSEDETQRRSEVTRKWSESDEDVERGAKRRS